MVLCCLFLVSVSVMFHLMFVKINLVRFRLLRGHRWENWKRAAHLVGHMFSLDFCLFVIVIYRFWF